MAVGECKINDALYAAQEMAKKGDTYNASRVAEVCYELARAQINHPVKEVRPSSYLLGKCKKLCVELGVKLWENSPAAEIERKAIAARAKRAAK